MKRTNKYTMICGSCEHEWSAVGQRDICPKCGCPNEFEEHIIRDEKEHYKHLEPEDINAL